MNTDEMVDSVAALAREIEASRQYMKELGHRRREMIQDLVNAVGRKEAARLLDLKPRYISTITKGYS